MLPTVSQSSVSVVLTPGAQFYNQSINQLIN